MRSDGATTATDDRAAQSVVDGAAGVRRLTMTKDDSSPDVDAVFALDAIVTDYGVGTGRGELSDAALLDIVRASDCADALRACSLSYSQQYHTLMELERMSTRCDTDVDATFAVIARTSDMRTPSRGSVSSVLHVVARLGYVKTMQAYIDRGANVVFGNNALLINAARHGHDNIVKILLDVPGVDVNAQGGTAIRFAAKNGHVAVVRTLYEAGSNVIWHFGSAVNRAWAAGHMDVVEYLMQQSRTQDAIAAGRLIVGQPTVLDKM